MAGPGSDLEQEVGASGVHCIDCFLLKRLVSRALTSDSTNAVDISWPAGQRELRRIGVSILPSLVRRLSARRDDLQESGRPKHVKPEE